MNQDAMALRILSLSSSGVGESDPSSTQIAVILTISDHCIAWSPLEMARRKSLRHIFKAFQGFSEVNPCHPASSTVASPSSKRTCRPRNKKWSGKVCSRTDFATADSCHEASRSSSRQLMKLSSPSCGKRFLLSIIAEGPAAGPVAVTMSNSLEASVMAA